VPLAALDPEADRVATLRVSLRSPEKAGAASARRALAVSVARIAALLLFFSRALRSAFRADRFAAFLAAFAARASFDPGGGFRLLPGVGWLLGVG
jgi:hypothetical protein